MSIGLFSGIGAHPHRSSVLPMWMGSENILGTNTSMTSVGKSIRFGLCTRTHREEGVTVCQGPAILGRQVGLSAPAIDERGGRGGDCRP